MSLLLRFQGGFGVDSYSPDTIIRVPQDVAEKSGRFETDYYMVNVKVPLGSLNRFLHVTCDETGNFLRDLYSDETYDGAKSPLGNWYLDVPAVLAKWAEAGFPLNWELGLASDLTDSELAEQARLDELYDARLAALAEEDELVEMQLADWEEAVHLAELYEASLAELELAEAKWAEETSAAEWAEEARIAGCSIEGAPYSWNYDMQ